MTQENANIYLDQKSRACIDKATKFVQDLYKETNPDQHLDWLYAILHFQGNVTDKIRHLEHCTVQPEIKEKLTQFNLFSELYNHRYKSNLVTEIFNKELSALVIKYQNIHPAILSTSEQQRKIRKLLYVTPGTLTITQKTKANDLESKLKIDIQPLYQILHRLHHLCHHKLIFVYNEDIRPSLYTVIEPSLAKLYKRKSNVKYEADDGHTTTITGHSAVLEAIYKVFETLINSKKSDVRVDILLDAPTVFSHIYQQVGTLEINNLFRHKLDLQLRMALLRISRLVHEQEAIGLPTYKQ